MLNLYKTMSRQQQAGGDDRHTGHDRFTNVGHGDQRTRRRRKPPTRRAHSALELNPQALAVARASLQRSASTETDPNDSSEERTPLLGRLFSCVNVTSTVQAENSRPGGRYEYTALEAESSVHERLELERQARAQAQTACLHYLRCCPRYSLLHHLNDIGSRVDKQWFVVRDISVKTERLLTLVPRSNSCPIQCDAENRSIILELFLALQHPYIYPVLDLEFQEAPSGSEVYIILVLPFNDKGSLKDLIYQSSWQDDWCEKYSQRTEGLPATQVQRLGRQILEALLFLKERGFPSCTHLHSGNVILQNGVARLSGLENTLFGFTSRIHPVVWTLAKADPAAIDIICFGHILFEMCAGYELKTPQPNPANYLDIDNYPQVVEVLEFIFQNPKRRFPSIEELLLHEFFRNIDLREMRASSLSQVYHAHLSAPAISLLNLVKQFQLRKRLRQDPSMSAANPPSPPPRGDRESSGDICQGFQQDDATKELFEDEDNKVENHMSDNEVQEKEDDKSKEEEEEGNLDDCAQEHRNLTLHIQPIANPIRLESSSFLR